MECQAPAIALHQGPYIHHFGLERIEAIQPDPDQIFEDFVHVAAGVNENNLAGIMDDRIHPLEHRINKLVP